MGPKEGSQFSQRQRQMTIPGSKMQAPGRLGCEWARPDVAHWETHTTVTANKFPYNPPRRSPSLTVEGHLSGHSYSRPCILRFSKVGILAPKMYRSPHPSINHLSRVSLPTLSFSLHPPLSSDRTHFTSPRLFRLPPCVGHGGSPDHRGKNDPRRYPRQTGLPSVQPLTLSLRLVHIHIRLPSAATHSPLTVASAVGHRLEATSSASAKPRRFETWWTHRESTSCALSARAEIGLPG
ncbi:hypothetical protein VTK73DRAFT_7750 [Phialemonium thermophilum]|uniref:Uncharacterized protein n=1 Tax=Phialemonium thermophilum TaxID=223376 RepID=A0ABR3XSK3_9PEZI